MNKFVLFFCIILFPIFSKCEEISDETLSKAYDMVVIITKGMCNTDEKQCSTALENNKDKLMPIIKDMIKDIQNGDTISTVASKYVTKIIFIDGIGNKCNVFGLLSVVPKFSSPEGIKEIGDSISNNSSQIYPYVQTVLNGESNEAKLMAIGHIISIIFAFYVH